MHMADALISPPVAAIAGAVSIGLIIKASREIKKDSREGLTSMMGVLGAFVFAAQMINFTIPGTGSSGHIIGGLLLAALLGPWAAFLTLSSVLIVQCLIFADGGLMALGCNILNMAAMSCLIAYPLVYRPIVNGAKGTPSVARLITASVLSCVIGLELGAFLVSIETVASGVTALPFVAFISVMLPIHLLIGACEGIATGLVLAFVLKNSPVMMGYAPIYNKSHQRHSRKITLLVFGIAALILASLFTWIASSNPDGLEWSIARITGEPELEAATTPVTAFLPDYESYFAGIIGTMIVLALIWALSIIVFRKKRQAVNYHTNEYD